MLVVYILLRSRIMVLALHIDVWYRLSWSWLLNEPEKSKSVLSSLV